MRRVYLGAAVLLAVALAFTAAQPASAGCGGVKHVRAKNKRVPGRAPLAIGDSVLLGALGEVSGAGFEIDTRGCRQMREGLDVMRRRRRAGTLPRFVAVALGTNLAITPSQVRTAVRIMGPKRVLALVTPRGVAGGSGSSATVVRRAGRRYPGRVIVLDWVRRTRGRGNWFSGDGIHLSRAGAAGLARLLLRGLRRAELLDTRWSEPEAR